jgi:hypothetical protein
LFLSNLYKKANNIPGYAIGIIKYHEHLTLTTRASIGANKYKGLLKLFSSAYIDVLTEKTTKTILNSKEQKKLASAIFKDPNLIVLIRKT